jgi:PAS domain S-box-containing protein
MDANKPHSPGTSGIITHIVFVLILCLTLPPGFVSARERYEFRHYTVEHGILQNTITCILQDYEGYLWLGTESGLNRFDGIDFKPFEHTEGKADSLSNNYVQIIYEDRSHILWVGTQAGLDRFDRNTGTFTFFQPKYKDSQGHNKVVSIYEDRAGKLWVGTEGGGIYTCNRRSGELTYYGIERPAGFNANNRKHLEIYSMLEDSTGVFWVGTGNGLYQLDRQRGRFFRSDIENRISRAKEDVKYWVIFEDTRKTMWFGTAEHGLIGYNRKSEEVTPYKYNANVSGGLCAGEVRAIVQDREKSNVLWLGVHRGGVCRFDTQRVNFKHFKEKATIPTSLSSNRVYSLCLDRTGILWVGTESGLNKLEMHKNRFELWTAEQWDENRLSDGMVWSLFKDSSGTTWVGTNKGLDRIDRQSGKVEHYAPQNSGLSHSPVFAVREDRAGMIWVGTGGGGLNRLDPRTGTFRHFRKDINNPAALNDDSISTILFDKSGVMWVGTENGGLNRFNPGDGTFYHYTNQPGDTGSLSHNHVTYIYEDPGGELWVGTQKGLNRFNRENGKETFTRYFHDSKRSDSLSADHISSVLKDRSGTMWVGTYGGGLNWSSPGQKDKFFYFRKKRPEKTESENDEDSNKGKEINQPPESKDWLPSDVIYGILEDKKGNLWLSSDKGLTRFVPERKSPGNTFTGKGSFKNYNFRDGLQSNEFNGRACFKAENDEEMFFGGIKGFNAFYPGKLEKNSRKPRVVFTDFKVFNTSRLLNIVNDMPGIKLSYKEYSIRIEFSALDFTIPENNKYSYKMEGINHRWVNRDADERFAWYPNLSPGKYVFRVSGSNYDDVWGDSASLKIVITPPFWETWWFQGLILLLILVLVFNGHRLRTRRLREKLQEQKRVQAILKQSRDEMEKARDLAEIRRAENELLLTAISSLFIAVDSDGYIFECNKPAQDFFEISRQQVLKRPFVEVLNFCIHVDKLNEIVDKGLKQDRSSGEIEINVDFSTRGEGIKSLLSTISPIMDETGKKLGFLLLAEDITNRKEEEILRNLSKKLEALGQMASGIAHEIKTPLQYIAHNARFVSDSFMEVVKLFRLLNEQLPNFENSGDIEIITRIKRLIALHDMDYIMEEMPKASEQIIDGVGKVSEIIQSMTEYTYPGRGFKEKCDINELLKSTLVVVQNSIKKRADIHLELFDRLPRIPCYPGELSQVFLNMLVNASDAVDESGVWGQVRIATYLENGEIVISISDTGTGIPESHKDNIFNPFFTTKEAGKGTGQGLSLAHNVVIEKHGGKLDFTSKVGAGTTFFIRLPLEKEGEH